MAGDGLTAVPRVKRGIMLKNISDSTIELSWNGKQVSLKSGETVHTDKFETYGPAAYHLETRFVSKYPGKIVRVEAVETKEEPKQEVSEEKPKVGRPRKVVSEV